MEENGAEHRTSSPGHQQANGRAESAVKTSKTILRKKKKSKSDPYLAILAARNTPTEYMDSSSVQRLLGRCTKTQLPITAELLKPKHVNTEDINKQIKTRQQKQANYYNRKARDLPPLQDEDVEHMCQCLMKPDLGELSVSWHTWRTIQKTELQTLASQTLRAGERFREQGHD